MSTLTRIPTALRTLMETYFPTATSTDLQNIAKLTRSDRQWLEDRAKAGESERRLLEALRLKFSPSSKLLKGLPPGPLGLDWWNGCAGSQRVATDWRNSQASSLPRWSDNLVD